MYANIRARTSIGSAIDYVYQLLRHNLWEDFYCEMGMSNQWVTCHILLMLNSTLANTVANGLNCIPYKYIYDLLLSNSSLGYNHKTRPDSDSTAFGLRLLECAGVSNSRITQPIIDKLISYQNTDGGFCTFKRRCNNDNWAVSLPDITANVILALHPYYHEYSRHIDKALRYLEREQHLYRDHIYWWNTTIYTYYIVSEASKYYKIDIKWPIVSTCSVDSLELSWLIMYYLNIGIEANELANELLDRQNYDGSWPGTKLLMLPEPYNAETKHVVNEPNRLYTTATCISALNRVFCR